MKRLFSYLTLFLLLTTAMAIENTAQTLPQQTTEIQQIRDYYTPVQGLTGTALKTGLHNLISTNTYSSYDGAKTIMFQDLDNNNGVVRCVYTGQDFTITSDYNGSSSPNTEHTYAQSWFTASASVEKADLHHLFVTESTVNSSRGNLPFGKVITQTTTYSTYNGYVSKRGTDFNSQTVFEPADQHKGDCARALLYFNVRYNETLTQASVDMLPACLQWNLLDPPTAAEVTRNTAIQSTLTNRNPFVDHPEYVNSIWLGTTNNTMLNFSSASASVAENVGTTQLTIQILHQNVYASNAQVYLVSGNAAHIGNFTPVTINFPMNSSTPQTVTINVTDDNIVDGNETFVFGIKNASGGYYAIPGLQSTFTLTVQDDDVIANDDNTAVTGIFGIQSVYPNPFNPETNINYNVSKAEHVSLVVFNVRGQKVKTLASGSMASGSYDTKWNGTDENGTPVSNGIYYLKMREGNKISLKKIVLIK
ncbi:MAG TPA: endonuclease [Candidatus Cloacimonadota bacterium]|nr:endonuclease [Candidatus Cloacimonadota bacterium]HPT70784.1 endonuclease [Candidatus Cloacimonadota bacterium]